MWQILVIFAVHCFCAVPPTPLIQTKTSYIAGVEWYKLNGKTADPCASLEGLSSARRHCRGQEWPNSAVTVLLPQQQAAVGGTNTLKIWGKNIPYPATGNAARLYLSEIGGTCDNIDTSIAGKIADVGDVDACVTNPIINSANRLCTSLSFTFSSDEWVTIQRELEELPRSLCYSDDGTSANAFYTGFKIAVVWNCDDTVESTQCSNIPIAEYSTFLTPVEAQMRRAKTTCCRHANFGEDTVAISVGQCINPNVQTCCQGAAIEPTTTRCCNQQFELTQYHDRPCPCHTRTSTAVSCPSDEKCCEFSKYKELTSLPTATWPQMLGECYREDQHQCCDTGMRYDPGQHQCCTITGVQSLKTLCPCNSDIDCEGGQTNKFLVGRTNGMICCSQKFPPPFEAEWFATGSEYVTTAGTLYPRCSKYANYPSGTGAYESQRCLGVCMDNRYQICCNGVVCRKEYEKCCNSTCCNKFVGTCTDSMRPATPHNKHNYIELRIRYEVCSQIEQLDPIRAWWVFVLPTYLLAATVLGVTIVIAVINRSSRRNYSFIEKSIMLIAFLTIIFAFPCYFAPVYKYGVWVVFVSIVTALTASSKLRWLNIVCVFLQFWTLLYLFDPFHGNNYLTFASLRVSPGGRYYDSYPDPESAGLLPSVHKMFWSLESVREQEYCTRWYDYFKLDPQMYDVDRFHNVDVPTFGYCTRGWVTALLVFEGLVLILTMFQFVLCLIALILRFREERTSEPIELEVREADEVAPMAPYY